MNSAVRQTNPRPLSASSDQCPLRAARLPL